jgi:hypothetical protein
MNPINHLLYQVIFVSFLFCPVITIKAQENIKSETLLQTIQGRVIDKSNNLPLIGATIIINDSTVGTITDMNGYFEITGIQIGRNNIYVSYVGYTPRYFQNILVKPGKQTILNIELEENIEEIDEVTVNAYSDKSHSINDMALISARAFTIEETERFAGSWGDPSRMATNYAGVFVANDQGNDIIIRGNSPAGLIWRLEGIPIPSPNHWHTLGATGGPVSMLNNNVLQRSDFMTGAFPAEYGNGISGAFDLKMRNGNNNKREFVAQLGFNGFEFGAEGPLNKNSKASYLVNYRYSMLGLVDELLWVDALPHYQDLMFKLSFPGKKSSTSIFGLGGISKITFKDSARVSDDLVRYISELNGSITGIIGINHTYYFNNNTRLKTSIALTSTTPYGITDSLAHLKGPELKTLSKYEEQQNDIIIQSIVNHNINKKNKIKSGLLLHNYSTNYFEKDYYYDSEIDSATIYDPYTIKENNLILLQGFIEWKHRFSDLITIVSGLHYEYFLYNKTYSIEPRFSAQWKYAPKRSLSFGYGLHSKLVPIYMFVRKSFVDRENNGNKEFYQTNKNLDFIKSHQFVLGHDYSITPQLRLKTEIYYQYLFDVPVKREADYFWLLNWGEGLSNWCGEDSLVNKGTGENYGIELTFEKFFDKNYYFLFTTSLFNSTSKASDGIKRNTIFNGKFVINVLGGYELFLNQKNSLNFNIRLAYAGGRRYSPYILSEDPDKTYETDTENAYSLQLPNYFRTDARIGYMHYGRKATYEFAFDITNLTNHENLYFRYFDESSKTFEDEYQQGIFPIGLIRINF